MGWERTQPKHQQRGPGRGGGGITAANDISNAVVTLNYPSYVYDGQEHTCNVRNIESVVLNGVALNSFTDYGVSNAGVTSGVEAMGYPLVLVGAGNYTGQRAALWKIDKAVGTMTPNVSSVTLNSTQPNATVDIQWSGTGRLSNVTATSSNSSVVGVSTNGTNVEVTMNNIGEETITVSADKNNNDSQNTSFTVLAKYPINNVTWSDINKISQAGDATKYFNVGDEITFTTKDDKEVTMQIVGFNHDDLADGSGKAGITFGMKNLYYSTYPMNSSNTNSGGWDECKMRTETMQTLFNNLPDELQAVIKTVKKKATAGSQSTSITTSQDKLWLYSLVELNGTTENGYKDEGTQYEYWQSHNTNSDRIKKLNNGTGSANYYWLRSPYLGNSLVFWGVSSGGSLDWYTASASGGVCFCFCI